MDTMRRLIRIVEDAGDLTIGQVAGGLRSRYRVFEPDDFVEFAARFGSAEEFADRLVDPASPEAAEARAALTRAWTGWEQEGALGRARSGLAGLTGLEAHIAKTIGATAYRKAQAPEWGREMISSPDGYILTTEKGRVFLDAQIMPQRREIWLSEFSAERRGGGLGTAVMDAIRDYAAANGLGVRVMKVANHAFFRRFDWLQPDGEFGYRSSLR